MIGAELENLIRRIVREELRNATVGEVTPTALRIQANLTMEDLAVKAGVSKPTIARIVTARRFWAMPFESARANNP